MGSSPQTKAEQDEQEAISFESYDSFISTLPSDKGWLPMTLIQYQGYWIPENQLPGVMAVGERFVARPTDVLLVNYPKSGTTWLKALMFAVANRNKHHLDNHPLLHLNPHDCFPHLELNFIKQKPVELEYLPSPRFLATHVPFSLLPESVSSSGCRIISVSRDPKDLLISGWHFMQKMTLGNMEPLEFGKAVEMFLNGVAPYGPLWDHNLECWMETQRRPENVLFLNYEEMMAEPVCNVKKLAEFMGYPFSTDEKGGTLEDIVDLCSFDSLRSLEANKVGGHDVGFYIPNSAFFRKAKVGDWKNYMNPEMAERIDQIFKEKTEGSGFSY